MLALYMGAPNSLIQLLLQSGADPHHSDGRGYTVAHFVVDEQNVWAMKWLVAENVDLETRDGDPVDSRPVSQFLIDCCDTIMNYGDTDFLRVLDYLRVLQVLSVTWTNSVGDSFSVKHTQSRLIKRLNSFSKFRCPRSYYGVGDELQKIRDILRIFSDILSNPFSLRHLCRVQIRRSLGRDFSKKLNQLNVPLPLQEYLRVYKESDILLWFPGNMMSIKQPQSN